jgi:hypothetical protein
MENKSKNDPRIAETLFLSIFEKKELLFFEGLDFFFSLLDFLEGLFLAFLLSTGINSFSSIHFVLFNEYKLNCLRD